MRRLPLRPALALLLIAITLAATGCGTKQVTVTGANGQTTTTTAKNIHFANTKFVFHMGLAFGAFHRYIYKPLRHGTTHRVAAVAKGALAAAFILHELRIAREDAMASNQLRPLAVKIANFEAQVKNLVPGLARGVVSAGSVGGVASAVDSLGAQSDGVGAHISDLVHAL